MLVYLDSAIVIDAVEGAASFQARARAQLAALIDSGARVAISDLVCLECRIKPIQLGDTRLLADFETFFTDSDVIWLPMPSSVYERAARIRALHKFQLGDSLHLAAAVEHGCQTFLTNDTRLARFPDLAVEILP